MKISLAIIISSITVIIGLIFSKTNVWIPFSFLLASVIELSTRKWITSERLGAWKNFSVALKSLLSVVGFYALIGQIICIGIIIWWFI
jgi:hypothetical protein